jgi:hypothetical protein
VTIDGTSTICTCDCLDCLSRERHVLHDPPVPPVLAHIRDERDPLTPALVAERDAAIVTEAELRLMDGNR